MFGKLLRYVAFTMYTDCLMVCTYMMYVLLYRNQEVVRA